MRLQALASGTGCPGGPGARAQRRGVASAALCRSGDQGMDQGMTRGWLAGREEIWLEVGARHRNQGFADIVAHTYSPRTQEPEARGLVTSPKAD